MDVWGGEGWGRGGGAMLKCGLHSRSIAWGLGRGGGGGGVIHLA